MMHRITGTLVLFALVIAPSRGEDKAPSVTTQALILVDAGGVKRASLEVVDGEPCLTMFSNSGGKKLQLKLAADTSIMTMFDKVENPRVSLRVNENGESYFQMRDAHGDLRAEMSVGTTNEPRFAVLDLDGKLSAEIQSSFDRGGEFRILNEDNETVWKAPK